MTAALNDPSMYLLDKAFLKQLDEYPVRVIYCRLIALTFDERAKGILEGQVVSGSINVTGESAMRRTCQIQLTCEYDKINFTEIDWTLQTKFKCYIGLQNFINDKYPDIIWFPQGTFVITNFAHTLNDKTYTINITGKDKMCLLDGTVGGKVFAAHDFGTTYIYEGGMYKGEEKEDIRTIVKGIAHDYAGEPYSNIIIEDVDDVAVELLDNNSKNVNVYVFNIYTLNTTSTAEYGELLDGNNMFDLSSETTQMMLIDDEKYAYAKTIPFTQCQKLEEKLVWMKYHESLTGNFIHNHIGYHFEVGAEYGETIGYRPTDLTYAGDLTLSVGDPVTKALDMIVKMLGEFEYFYDVYGRFRFRRKLIYSNIAFTNEVVTNTGEARKERYYASAADVSKYSYQFTSANLISSFQNTPKLDNIKNDFSIWGEQTTSYSTRKIHMRYAIDDKPLKYFRLVKPTTAGIIEDLKWYCTQEYFDRIAADPHDPCAIPITEQVVQTPYDWRDLIYFMAYDRQQKDSHVKESTITKLANNNAGSALWSIGRKEVERWEAIDTTGYKDYYADVLAFWPLVHNVDILPPNPSDKKYQNAYSAYENAQAEYNNWMNNGKWNPNAFTYGQVNGKEYVKLVNPQNLLFWFDFMEDNPDMQKFKCSVIGHRQQMLTDDKVRAISYHSVPNVIFEDIKDTDTEDLIQNYTTTDDTINYVVLRIPDWAKNLLRTSTRGKSCVDTLEGLLYQHTFYQETINLQCVPVYYLEPNTKIIVKDEKTKIYGEYLIKSFNYSFTHDGLMSIQATRVTDDIL